MAYGIKFKMDEEAAHKSLRELIYSLYRIGFLGHFNMGLKSSHIDFSLAETEFGVINATVPSAPSSKWLSHTDWAAETSRDSNEEFLP